MKTSKHLQQFVEHVIMEQEQRPLYTALVMDALGAMKMRRVIQEQNLDRGLDGWLSSNIHPAHGNQQLNHHMTITPGALKPANPLRLRLGQDVILHVVGWGYDTKLGIAAWQIDTVSGFPTKTGVPHVTAMLENDSVKPFKAAKIKNWKKLPESFAVRGTFQEVFPRER